MWGTILKGSLLFVAAMLLLSMTGCSAYATEATEFGELSSDDFTYESRCRQCHAIIYSDWEGTMHFNAYLDPFYLEEVKVASEDTDGLVDEFCSRCHTPIGVVSGEIPPIDGSEMSDIAKLGVQCDFCHVVSGSNGTGNAPFTVTPGNTKWGPFDDSRSAYHDSEYLELYTQSEYCGMCHLVIHPVNGLVIDDTYTSWQESQYAEDEVVCQDCHMTDGITEFEANPGRAGSGAPKREHISSHDIVGANAFIPPMFGASSVADMAVERLQRAATLEISTPEIASAGEEVMIEAAITNSGAGHNIPTGVSEIRQMWLEVVVTDSEGNEIYNAGTLDADGNIEEAKIIYNNVLGDSNGSATDSFWLADRVLEDNRIGPKETVTEEHTFTLPDNVAYPLTVETSLNYRSAPQYMIDHLMGEDTEVPVISMNKELAIIYDPSTPIDERGQPRSSESTSTPGFSVFIALAALSITMYIFKRK
ncbi:cytochrome c family protein [Methanolobus profundi]|uniref:Cytochrome c554 and c-prime n=1 Tax=Methanolobus profundi TaxID=487685 RepID=A0A1I4R0C7_9EURY|nr:cytochrome c family protein [Methanolobus profundi]SFM45749.1 Cytochrome c554 and c-prime [Methanolobus profundi]